MTRSMRSVHSLGFKTLSSSFSTDYSIASLRRSNSVKEIPVEIGPLMQFIEKPLNSPARPSVL